MITTPRTPLSLTSTFEPPPRRMKGTFSFHNFSATLAPVRPQSRRRPWHQLVRQSAPQYSWREGHSPASGRQRWSSRRLLVTELWQVIWVSIAVFIVLMAISRLRAFHLGSNFFPDGLRSTGRGHSQHQCNWTSCRSFQPFGLNAASVLIWSAFPAESTSKASPGRKFLIR